MVGIIYVEMYQVDKSQNYGKKTHFLTKYGHFDRFGVFSAKKNPRYDKVILKGLYSGRNLGIIKNNGLPKPSSFEIEL